MTVADLNGDGKTDIIAANDVDNTVSVLLGNGNGTFQPAADLRRRARPDSVAVADLTGDGKHDIITANHARRHRERAAGQRQRHLPARDRIPSRRQSRDAPFGGGRRTLTGDGKPDIVVANSYAATA